MNDSTAERDPIDLLADSFVGRLRAGQRPSIAEYAARYPALAGELQELLPALVELEQNASVDSTGNGLASAANTAPPQRLDEYTIVREIGRGGMGVVYEAVQESLGRHVALKVLQIGGICGARLERFRREAKAAARLHHTNIVPVYGISEHAGVHYYAMQFIQGHSLNLVVDELKRLRKNPSRAAEDLQDGVCTDSSERASADGTAVAIGYSSNAPVSSEFSMPASADAFYRSVARVGLQVAEALAYAHGEGVVHRDIKPSNLLLDGRGTVWVTDFGLAKSDGMDDLTDSGDVVGTLQYMAPERLDGHADARGDVYGLGATLYELIALQPLFQAVARAKLIEHILYVEPLPLRKCDRRVPRDLETIIEKALVKEPSMRYESAQHMADDLRSFLADRTIRARRTTAAERLWRWRRRNPALATLTVALFLVFALGFAAVSWKWSEAELAREDERLARQEADRRAGEIQRGHLRLQEASRLVDVGESYAESGAWDDAATAFSLAIELRPELALAWEKRGELYFRLGLFDLAAADFRRAFALHEPILHSDWLRMALLQLYAGDTVGYAQVRNLMTMRIFGTANPYDAASLVRMQFLADVPQAEGRRWSALAAKAQIADPRAIPSHIIALAHYRTGRYREAIANCEKALLVEAGQELSYPTLAMTYHRLGKDEAAKNAFSLAVKARQRWMEALIASPSDQWRIHQGASANWPIDRMDWLEFEILLRQAANLLDLPVPSEDPQWHVLRARAYAGLRDRETAEREYRHALQINPDNERIQFEAYRNRGYHLAKREQFAEAAEEFNRALQFSPGDSMLWSYVATAQCAAGNTMAYRRTCAAMFSRFATEEDLSVLFNLTWTCTRAPEALSDMEALTPLAESAANWWIDSQRGLVSTHYRLRRFEEALRSFEQLSRVARPEPSTTLFAAMAHYQLGQRREARQILAQAIAAIAEPQILSVTRMPVPGFDPRGWTEKVSDRLLREEAEALILADESDVSFAHDQAVPQAH